MRKTIFSLTLMLAITCIVKAQPTAVLAANINSPVCPLLSWAFLGFGSTGTGPLTYYFHFGDDSILVKNGLPLAFHNYATPDTFNVMLVVEDGIGKDTAYDTVIIIDPFNVSFTKSSDTICQGQILNFASNIVLLEPSSVIQSQFWNFGDPNNSFDFDTLANTSYLYKEPGEYIVKIEVTDTSNCKKDYTDTIVVLPKPDLSSFDISNACPCNDINVLNTTSGTNSSWLWDFGDGTQSIVKDPSTHRYSIPGTYNISLKGIDANGCTHTAYKEITACNPLADSSVIKNKSNNRWYFSDQAGVDFNTPTPTALLDGQLVPVPNGEGASTISDPETGALLFYSEGEEIWDSSHTIMPNGNNIVGSQSASMSTLIIPFPGDKNKYYLFTSGAKEPIYAKGVHYSVIDMSLPGNGTIGNPLGDVVVGQKNILVDTIKNTEAMTGVQWKAATCSTDAAYWVVMPITETINSIAVYYYRAYPVTISGVGAPIISALGNSDADVAQCAFSPDRTKYAQAKRSLGPGGSMIELFDFDRTSGKLSNMRVLNQNADVSGGYGICFSPNSQLLYFNDFGNKIIQYDLNATNIDNSYTLIANVGGTSFATMQLSPDNQKIYMIKVNEGFLAAIDDPNVIGIGCNYVDNAINLGGRNARVGLQNMVPLYIQDTLKLDASYDIEKTCPSYTVTFVDTFCGFHYSGVETIWQYGDGIIDTFAEITYPTHDYPGPGTYIATLIMNKECSISDTFVQTVILDTIPEVLFVSDSACEGLSSTIISSVKYVDSIASYTWSGAFTDTLTNPNPLLNPGQNQVILTVTDTQGCFYSDTNIVIVKALPNILVSPDTTICNDESVNLMTEILSGDTYIDISYVWSPATDLNNDTISNPIAIPTESTTYSLQATNECGIDTASLTIETANCELFIPNAFSPNGDGDNDVFMVRGDGVNQLYLAIYDRWGNKVFESKSNNSNGVSLSGVEGWDGIGFNKGVYVYRLKVVMLDNMTFEQKGNITLVK